MNSIWAVAKNTIKQAIRMKIAVVFILLLLVLLPVLGVSATGDETIKGRLQTFISYGLSLTSLLLCLLTIAISIYTVTNDIKEKQIFTVVTKPIRRFQFLTGKLLGVILLDIFLLCIFSGIIYSIAIYMPKFYKATTSEMEDVNNEFFTARASLPIPENDFTKQAEQQYEKLKKQDDIPADMTRAQAVKEIANRMQIASRAADIGYGIKWEFDNVKPLAGSIFIRFKYQVLQDTPDGMVDGRWIVGEPHAVDTFSQGETPIFMQDFRHSVDTFHEIKIPAEVIPPSGRLAVVFVNNPLNDTIVLFPQDGMEVLFKADSFTMNFVRSVVLIFSRLVFLASLGVLTSTFLSFPVAILLCLVIFVTASASVFILESFDSLSASVGLFYAYTLKWMVHLLPQFDKYNPTKFLIPARLVTWSFLGQCILFMVCIKALLLLALAFLVFSFKEIAKIIV